MADKLFGPMDGIDEDTCLDMYDGNSDFYVLVLDTFCKEIARTHSRMKEAFDNEQIEDYRILVHGLKGSGGSAGATGLVALATKSNALIKEGDWNGAKLLHEPIMEEISRLTAMIPERISQKAGEQL